MSDNEEKKRPNANYKLSNENIREEQTTTFYYDRERRLAKAPKAVQDLYKNPPSPVRHRFNLFRPLVRTKHLTMMFISVVIISVFMLAISLLGLASDAHDLDGNQISIQAIRYEGTIILAIDKTVRKTGLARFSRSDTAYTGAVDIAVQPVLKADSGQDWRSEDIFYRRIFFSLEPEEYYRFSVPFDAGELALVFRTETKTVGLTVKAE